MAHRNTLTLKSDPSMRGEECPLTLNQGRPFIKTHSRKPLNDRDCFFPSGDPLPADAQPVEGMSRKRGNKQNYYTTLDRIFRVPVNLAAQTIYPWLKCLFCARAL
ncbi:hypothetical protein TNCT_262241 [Trichonephila clavata]|uniref:Uncharacterized protein n=1 Tax=Trichonephila clavata TaxID=2740835 RepID=A0A8X6G228_TRICU|nr:hypothetical protein TNCT_262241 [Trichonephila clavata]